MKITAIASAICISAVLAAPAMAQATTPATKTLAENANTVVTEAWLKPGETSPEQSRVGTYYYVDGGTFELTYKDGTRNTVTRESGTARISTDPKPYAVKNVGATTIHVIVIQSK